LGEASTMVETVRGAGYRLTAVNSPARPTQSTPLSAT
jgi:two-component system phosphate regulon response regulator PhoB